MTVHCPVCIKAITREEWSAHVLWHQPGHPGFDRARAREQLRQDLNDFGLSPASVRAELKQWDQEHPEEVHP